MQVNFVLMTSEHPTTFFFFTSYRDLFHINPQLFNTAKEAFSTRFVLTGPLAEERRGRFDFRCGLEGTSTVGLSP